MVQYCFGSEIGPPVNGAGMGPSKSEKGVGCQVYMDLGREVRVANIPIRTMARAGMRSTIFKTYLHPLKLEDLMSPLLKCLDST